MMMDYPLQFECDHLFIEIEEERWLLDTGSPTSFGFTKVINFSGVLFQFDSDYLGMDARQLSQFMGVDCVGLLGADIMNGFDLVFDVPNSVVHVSDGQLSCSGNSVVINAPMGIPIVEVSIRGQTCRAFFDTGAQLSYFSKELLQGFPEAGRFQDFHPDIGTFHVDTCIVAVVLGEKGFHLRCGSLPTVLAASLMVAGTQGIIGNCVMIDHEVGYFPRRQMLVL